MHIVLWVDKTICINYESLFSGKNIYKKKYFKILSAEIYTQHAER